MKCKILGYSRLQGTSKKTGNEYDFYTLAISYSDGKKGYTGQRVRELSVDPDQVAGIEKLTVPISADIAVDFTGRVTNIAMT